MIDVIVFLSTAKGNMILICTISILRACWCSVSDTRRHVSFSVFIECVIPSKIRGYPVCRWIVRHVRYTSGRFVRYSFVYHSFKNSGDTRCVSGLLEGKTPPKGSSVVPGGNHGQVGTPGGQNTSGTIHRLPMFFDRSKLSTWILDISMYRK